MSSMLLLVTLLSFSIVLQVGPARFASAREAVLAWERRHRDDLSIDSTLAQTSSGKTDLTVEVINLGGIATARYGEMDVFVDYTASDSSRVVQRLAYISGAPGSNQWTMESISLDVFHPGLWDPGETATLLLQLVPEVKGGSQGTVLIATPRGVGAQASFSG